MGSAICGPGTGARVDADKEKALIGWVELGRISRGTAWSVAARRTAGRVLRELGVTVHERTVGKWPGEHG